ncbi:MAG TPA: transposase [Thermodesulfobacteriota bacterium]
MARPLRIQYPGAWYHVMNRGASRQRIFVDENDRKDFLNLLGETSDMFTMQIHAYRLLDNHYHLLIYTPQGNISRSMRHLNGIYTQRFNRKHGTDGSIFRGRFKAILIDADSYLLEVMRYIHLNPDRANIVEVPEQYLWSSHNAYLEKRASLSWLVRDEVLGRFGERLNQSIKRYREFIRAGIPSDIEEFYTMGKREVILGAERFKDWVRTKLISSDKEDYEIPEAKDLHSSISGDHVIDIIMRRYKVSREALEGVHRGQWNEPRDVAIYLCRKECGLTLKGIATELGITAYTTISMAYRRVERRISKDDSFRRRLITIIKELNS